MHDTEPPQEHYKAMFEAAVVSLSEISEALGIDEEEAACANGNALILEAIGRKSESGEWQPIKTAPKDGTEIILRNGNRVGAACWCTWPSTPEMDDGGEGWSVCFDGDTWEDDKAPTHWMPLPAAPSASPPVAQTAQPPLYDFRMALDIADRAASPIAAPNRAACEVEHDAAKCWRQPCEEAGRCEALPGSKVVPREPTQEMVRAIARRLPRTSYDFVAIEAWKIMWDAAPAGQAQGDAPTSRTVDDPFTHAVTEDLMRLAMYGDRGNAAKVRAAVAQCVEQIASYAYADGRDDEQQELASVLPGVTYMDPPDGGSPTVLEQLRRMAKDAARWRMLPAFIEAFQIDYVALKRAIDAELPTEVQEPPAPLTDEEIAFGYTYNYDALPAGVDAQGDALDAKREPGFIKPDTDSQVFFYEQDFYVLSNFSAFNLEWEGLTFPTSEHAYHWAKFEPHYTALRDELRTAPSAHEAFKLAERNKHCRREDWDDVKVRIMFLILRAKADQHEYVRRKLLATGDRELIEDSWRDDFWGWGPNRDGKNMLGKLWMEVRAELRAAMSKENGNG